MCVAWDGCHELTEILSGPFVTHMFGFDSVTGRRVLLRACITTSLAPSLFYCAALLWCHDLLAAGSQYVDGPAYKVTSCKIINVYIFIPNLQ